MKVINFKDLKKDIGVCIASSPWFVVEQVLIDNFAKVTGDEQWIHIDPERCTNESPYQSTIAHGYLLLSLIPKLAQQSYRIDGVTTKINYGLNQVRFLQPVKPQQKIRANFFVEQCQETKSNTFRLEVKVEIEIQASKKLACVANTVVLCIS